MTAMKSCSSGTEHAAAVWWPLICACRWTVRTDSSRCSPRYWSVVGWRSDRCVLSRACLTPAGRRSELDCSWCSRSDWRYWWPAGCCSGPGRYVDRLRWSAPAALASCSAVCRLLSSPSWAPVRRTRPAPADRTRSWRSSSRLSTDLRHECSSRRSPQWTPRRRCAWCYPGNTGSRACHDAGWTLAWRRPPPNCRSTCIRALWERKKSNLMRLIFELLNKFPICLT